MTRIANHLSVIIYSGVAYVSGWGAVILANVPDASVWSRFAAQVPALCVLVFLVIYFLKHMAEMKRDERDDRRVIVTSFQEQMRDHTTALESLNGKATKVLDDSAKALTRVEKVLERT